MSIQTDVRAAAYTRPASRAEVLADALGCIITGRALPESLQAPAFVGARPATAEEGCAAIVAGPRGR